MANGKSDADDLISQEKWKDISEFPGYQVSNLGKVRSFWNSTGGIIKSSFIDKTYILLRPKTKKSGHREVRLKINGEKKYKDFCVHRLVLVAFVGPCPEKMECCHNNGDAGDNRLVNLRWDTHSNNCKDAVAHGTAHRGEANGNSILTLKNVTEIRKFDYSKATHKEIAKIFNVSSSTIKDVVNGRTWFYGDEFLPKKPIRIKIKQEKRVAPLSKRRLNSIIDNINGDKIHYDFSLSVGEKHGHSKLKNEDILSIRYLNQSGRPLSHLAKMFDVNVTTISGIVLGETWKHVGGPIRKKKKGGSPKLIEQDVINIRNRNLNGESLSSIAKSYNMKAMAIHSIVTGKTWKHVGGHIRPIKRK